LGRGEARCLVARLVRRHYVSCQAEAAPSINMLRTLTPHQNESELVRLCHQKAWNSVLRRCQSHPGEASPSDACLRGVGSTALAVAIRGGAPPRVIEALLSANPHQVAMTNNHRGSVLHEGLKHRCSDEVLNVLLSAVIDYQTTSLSSFPPPPPPVCGRRRTPLHSWNEECHHQSFKHVSIQEHRFVRCPNLFETTDDVNRTPLHWLVERARTLTSNFRRSDEAFRFFQALLSAFPDAVRAVDADGHTPLLLLLMTPRGPVVGGKLESDICRMVRLMLSVCPGASSLAHNRGNSGAGTIGGYRGSRQFSTRTCASSSSSKVLGSSVTRSAAPVAAVSIAAPLPLYYAILHGRSLETIQLLLRDHRHALGQPAGSLAVTNLGEALLHVAVTTRAPPAVLYELVNDCPESTCYADVFGLTSMDWVWIRHCLDCHQTGGDAAATIRTTRIVSRRRLVPSGFSHYHQRSLLSIDSIASARPASSHFGPEDPTPQEPSALAHSTLPQNPVALRSFQEELLRRIKLLVPVAASTRASASSTALDGSEGAVGDNKVRYPFSLMHAVCYVPCPNAFVHVALTLDNPSTVCGSLRARDAFLGRLPLHYAASRSSHVTRVPTGATSSDVHAIKESSVVAVVAASFPDACRVTDSCGQLPLHVAIDTYKHRTSPGTLAAEQMSVSDDGSAVDGDESKDETVMEGLMVIQTLLAHFPGSLDRRDGRTGLFPWQQSGVGPSAPGARADGSRFTTSSTTHTFVLLRACPTAGLATGFASL
jgi:hypothetical protein